MTRQQRLALLSKFNAGLKGAQGVQKLKKAYQPLKKAELEGMDMRKFRGLLDKQHQKIRGRLKMLDMCVVRWREERQND